MKRSEFFGDHLPNISSPILLILHYLREENEFWSHRHDCFFFFQHGLTPLHMSCQGNHSSTSVLLIDNKAPVNAVATVRTHDLLQNINIMWPIIKNDFNSWQVDRQCYDSVMILTLLKFENMLFVLKCAFWRQKFRKCKYL